MPPITPLNTDPAPGTAREAADGIPRQDTLSADPAAPRLHEVTPSARLSLRFPLPTLNDNSDIAT